MAPLTPILVPTTSLVKGMMATIRMIKGMERPMLTIQPRIWLTALLGPDAVGLGDGQRHAQRQTQNDKQTGWRSPTISSVSRVPVSKIAAVLGKERRNGIKHEVLMSSRNRTQLTLAIRN